MMSFGQMFASAVLLLLSSLPTWACDIVVDDCDVTIGSVDAGKTVCVNEELECGSGEDGIRVNADNVTVRCGVDGSLSGPGSERGILTDKQNQVEGLRIYDCEISGFDTGIRLREVTDAEVDGNTLSNNDKGIDVANSIDVVVRGNAVDGPIGGFSGSGILFTKTDGEIDLNTVSNMDEAIIVEGDAPPVVQTVVVTRNTATLSRRGIVLTGVSGGPDYSILVEDNDANLNNHGNGYGIDVREGAERIVIRDNDVLGNGNEGIHLSGKVDDPCPSPLPRFCCLNTESDPGENILEGNTVMGAGEEGIYVVCSDGNRISRNGMVDNDVSNNGTAGIFLDEHATGNWIEGNQLLNDTVEIRELSEKNVIIDNQLSEDDGSSVNVKFSGASRNFVGATTVNPDGSNDAFTFQDRVGTSLSSTCNQIVDSSALQPTSSPKFDIKAIDDSLNNRFLRLAFNDELSCSVSAGSSIGVTNEAGAAVQCGTNSIDETQCSYWFATRLCGEGAALNEAPGDRVFEGTQISDVQYIRARGGKLTTREDSGTPATPFRVTSTGCTHLAATDRVVLGAGTVVEPGGRLSVGF